MQKYFGPLRNSDIDTFASDAFAHETHNLPRAYVGRNKFLMATIDFLITKDDDWYTRYILPWLYTEEIHVKWNIWRFNRTMMDYEPEQGVPRYVSYESESRSDSLVRRGLAFIIEHGFYKTEIGRQHYLMNLKQIVEAVHETVYYGVMHELLAAPNYYQEWHRKHGGSNYSTQTNDAITLMAEERWRFACVQKDIKGLFVLDAEVKDRMRRVGIEPDAWVFPSKMAIYASMVPEYFNEYRRGGQGVSALEEGPKRFDTFRGNRVFETRTFDTDFMSESAVEPLSRTREIGEYYVLGENGLKELHDGIRIFDMSRDKFHKIDTQEACKHVSKGNENWVNDLVKGCFKKIKAKGDTVNDVFKKSFGEEWKDTLYTNSNTDWPETLDMDNENEVVSFLRNMSHNLFEKEASVEQIRELMKIEVKDPESLATAIKEARFIPFPFKLVIYKPRMTYQMATAVLLKGGEELGQTLHGHHDFQLTDDVIHKTHIGHYTFYSKSVVREPKNMYLAEDVFCTGYKGGDNTKFVDEVSEFSTASIDSSSGSLLAAIVHRDADLKACMAAGSNDPLQEHGAEGSSLKCAKVSNYCGTTAMNTVRHMDDDEQEDGNSLCFRGAEQTRDKQGHWQTRHRNTGHWGPNVYDGCASVRIGMYAHLKDIG